MIETEDVTDDTELVRKTIKAIEKTNWLRLMEIVGINYHPGEPGDPDTPPCPVCGQRIDVKAGFDYCGFCGTKIKIEITVRVIGEET